MYNNFLYVKESFSFYRVNCIHNTYGELYALSTLQISKHTARALRTRFVCCVLLLLGVMVSCLHWLAHYNASCTR